MADTQTTTRAIKLEFTLENANYGQTKRTLTFDTGVSGQDAKTAVQTLKPRFLGEWKYIIQPSSWRDNDINEEAYQTIGLTGKYVTTSTVEWDI